MRLDGTNDVEGRRLLQEADLPNVYAAATMNEAAEMVVALAAGPAGGGGRLMSVLVDEHTRLARGRHHRPRGDASTRSTTAPTGPTWSAA